MKLFTQFLLGLISISVAGILLFIVVSLLSVQREDIIYSDVRSFYTGGLMLKNGVKGELYNSDTQYSWQKSFIPELKSKKALIIFDLIPPAALMYVPFTSMTL